MSNNSVASSGRTCWTYGWLRWADEPAAFWATLAEEAEFDESRRRAFVTGVVWFVILQDGRIVGAAGGVPNAGGETELIGMWAAPEVRGRGFGASLVAAVCDWARGIGASTVGLWIVEGNGRARSLYEQCGFRSTGESAALPAPHVGVEQRLQLTPRSPRDSIPV